jgi:hypothetical protein
MLVSTPLSLRLQVRAPRPFLPPAPLPRHHWRAEALDEPEQRFRHCSVGSDPAPSPPSRPDARRPAGRGLGAVPAGPGLRRGVAAADRPSVRRPRQRPERLGAVPKLQPVRPDPPPPPPASVRRAISIGAISTGACLIGARCFGGGQVRLAGSRGQPRVRQDLVGPALLVRDHRGPMSRGPGLLLPSGCRGPGGSGAVSLRVLLHRGRGGAGNVHGGHVLRAGGVEPHPLRGRLLLPAQVLLPPQVLPTPPLPVNTHITFPPPLAFQHSRQSDRNPPNLPSSPAGARAGTSARPAPKSRPTAPPSTTARRAPRPRPRAPSAGPARARTCARRTTAGPGPTATAPARRPATPATPAATAPTPRASPSAPPARTARRGRRPRAHARPARTAPSAPRRRSPARAASTARRRRRCRPCAWGGRTAPTGRRRRPPATPGTCARTPPASSGRAPAATGDRCSELSRRKHRRRWLWPIARNSWGKHDSCEQHGPPCGHWPGSGGVARERSTIRRGRKFGTMRAAAEPLRAQARLRGDDLSSESSQ